MLTRSQQRLIESKKNINNENLKSLKRKRSTTTKKQVEKENFVPSSLRYSLRSRKKIENDGLKLKSKNENIINKERSGLKEKLLKNIVKVPIDSSLKKKTIKENNDDKITNDQNKKELKEDKNNKIVNNDVRNKVVILIESNNFQNNIKKEATDDKAAAAPLDEPRNKKAKIEKKEKKKSILISKSEDKPINNKSKVEKQTNKIVKNDQKMGLAKSSISKKKDDNNNIKEKKKITFNDKIKENDKSVFIIDSFSSNNDSINNIKKLTNSNQDDDHLSSIKEKQKQKQTNDIIVPFIRLDSLDSDTTSTSSSTETNNTNKVNSNKNTLERKFSDLSDKSLEILNEINAGSGKTHISSLLESLDSRGHLKSSTPNNFNRTLLFLEESPINYTRILNEEMNFHVPLSTRIKSPEKEVSNLSQNTSFQDSNTISNFINISPISNSDIQLTDSDFDRDCIQPCELIDESDLFNTDDKSSLYSVDELDEKIKKLLSGNDNFNLVSDDDNKNILRYSPISPENLNNNNNNKYNNNGNNNHENKNNPNYMVNKIASSSRSKSDSKTKFEVKPIFSSSSLSSSKNIKELTFNQSKALNQFNLRQQDSLSSNSSSDDPFGFSKAEKIYKTKQQQIKSGTHTPTSVPSIHYYNTQKDSHTIDNVNEILMKEHQNLIEYRKKNRNRKKLKVEDMEELDSQDLKELKQAKDQQIKYFKEIDDYVLNESIL